MPNPNRSQHGTTSGTLSDLRSRTRRDATSASEQIDVQRTVVTFGFDTQVFAAEVAQIREILDMRPVSVLPNTPRGLMGLIDLRGESIAIIDLSVHLGLASKPGPDSRMIVFELESGGQLNIGVVADRVLGVVDISGEAIEPVPETLTGWSSAGVTGIVRIEGRQVVLLNLGKLLGQLEKYNGGDAVWS